MKKNNLTAYIAISLLIVAASFYFSYSKILPEYTKAKAQLSQLKEEVSSAESKLESLKKAKVTLAELGDQVDQMYVAVPGDSDVPNLITELEAIANYHTITLPTIQFRDGSAAKNAKTGNASNIVSVSMGVNGTFENLAALINSLENDIKYFNIKSLTLTSGEKEMSLSLQMETRKRKSVSLVDSSADTSAASGSSSASSRLGDEE